MLHSAGRVCSVGGLVRTAAVHVPCRVLLGVHQEAAGSPVPGTRVVHVHTLRGGVRAWPGGVIAAAGASWEAGGCVVVEEIPAIEELSGVA